MPCRTSSETASTRPEPHSPRGLDVADHAELDRRLAAGSILTTSIAPSAARMPQRIAPPSNAGPAGAAVETMRVAVADHDLAVGADVDEQPGALVAVHAGGEHARPRCRRRRTRRGPGRAPPGPAGAAVRPISVGEHGRRQRRRTSRTARRRAARGRCRGAAPSSSRCRRSPPRRRRPGRPRPPGRPARRAPRGCARGGGLQPAERVGVHHRGADPGDHVAAEGLLLVEHRGDRDRGAGGDVEQGGDHGRGAEVEGDRVRRARWCRRARRRPASCRRSPRSA